MICLLCKSTKDSVTLITSTPPTKQKLSIFFPWNRKLNSKTNLKTGHPAIVLKAFTSYHFIHSMNYFTLFWIQISINRPTSRTRCLMKERCGKTDQSAFFVTLHRRKQGTRKTYIIMKVHRCLFI